MSGAPVMVQCGNSACRRQLLVSGHNMPDGPPQSTPRDRIHAVTGRGRSTLLCPTCGHYTVVSPATPGRQAP